MPLPLHRPSARSIIFARRSGERASGKRERAGTGRRAGGGAVSVDSRRGATDGCNLSIDPSNTGYSGGTGQLESLGGNEAWVATIE